MKRDPATSAGAAHTGAARASIDVMAVVDPVEARVLAALDATGVPYEVLECDPAFADTAAFCEHYGIAPSQSANTIVVASKQEPKQYVACVVLATTRLDVNGAVRRRMGVSKAS